MQKDLTPIKDVYQNDFLIGTTVAINRLSGDRFELLKKHFNITTAENAMKPQELQKKKGVFSFTGADMVVGKVLAEGFKMHGHTLVWYQQTSDWMFNDDRGNALGRDETLTNMKDHIRNVMEHYANKVISWDVVNEV